MSYMVKIYWIFGMPYGKCFFRFTREKAECEVAFRKEYKNPRLPKEITDPVLEWKVIEEEVDKLLFGECINEHHPQLARTPDCSVGMIRKSRNGVPYDDGRCETCPYFKHDTNFEETYNNAVASELHQIEYWWRK